MVGTTALNTVLVEIDFLSTPRTYTGSFVSFLLQWLHQTPPLSTTIVIVLQFVKYCWTTQKVRLRGKHELFFFFLCTGARDILVCHEPRYWADWKVVLVQQHCYVCVNVFSRQLCLCQYIGNIQDSLAGVGQVDILCKLGFMWCR